jgi:hypothetical protein
MNEHEPVGLYTSKVVTTETLHVTRADGRQVRFDIAKDTTVTEEPLEQVDPTIIEQCVTKEEKKLIDETRFMSRYRKIGRIVGVGVGIATTFGDLSLDQLPLRIGFGALWGSVVYAAIGEGLSRADLLTKVRPQNKETRERIALLKTLPTAPQ